MVDPSRRVRFGQAFILLAIFLPVLNEWVSYCSKVSRLGYVLLVPILAAALAVQAGRKTDDAADETQRLRGTGGALGPLVLLGSALLYGLGSATGIFTLSIAAVPLAISGLVASWGGRRLVRRQARALVMAAFLVPVPLPLLDGMNPGLVDASGTVAVFLLGFLDPGTSWVGSELGFEGWTLIVADACSGSGTSLSLFVLTVFLTGLFGLSPLSSGALALLVLPLSLVVNALRIAATALLLAHIGPQAAAGLPHEILGQVLVIGTMGLLTWLVLRLTRHPSPAGPATEAAA